MPLNPILVRVEKALLDLGASVNLLPFHVYLQLGLGEMKPTQMTLQLADRSVKIPRGVIEDVLIEVDKFIYPVDFVVLDTRFVKEKPSSSKRLDYLNLESPTFEESIFERILTDERIHVAPIAPEMATLKALLNPTRTTRPSCIRLS